MFFSIKKANVNDDDYEYPEDGSFYEEPIETNNTGTVPAVTAPVTPIAPLNNTPIPTVPVSSPVSDELTKWQSLNKKYVENISNFIKRNLDFTEDHAAEVIKSYKNNHNAWETFKQLSSQLNLKESFEDFVSRLSSFNTKHTEQKDQEFSDENLQTSQKIPERLEQDLSETVFYIESVLTDWIESKAREVNSFGDISVVAEGISGAVNNLFTGNKKGGVPKWIDFAASRKMLPQSSEQLVLSKGLKNGIYEDANIWYSQNEEIYPLLQQIRELADQEDPSLLKAIESSAKYISSYKGQYGSSLDKDIGEVNSVGSITGDSKAANPYDAVDEVKSMLPESEEIGGLIADDFIEENPQFIEQLKGATHYVTGENLIQSLVNAKIADESTIIESAIKESFTGKKYEKVLDNKTKEYVYTTNAENNQWVEIFKNNPQLLPPNIKSTDTDAIQDNEKKLFKTLASPENKELIKSYMSNPLDQDGPAYEYLVFLYETNRVYDKNELNKKISDYGNISTFSKISSMVNSFLKRGFETYKVTNPDSAETYARAYVTNTEKTKSILSKLQLVLNSYTPAPLGNKYFIVRTKDNQVKIGKNMGSKKSVDPSEDPMLGPITDQNISMLQLLAYPRNYIPEALKKLSKIYPPALSKQDKNGNPLYDIAKKNNEEYIANNPTEEDRLKGYRIFTGNNIKNHISRKSSEKGLNLTTVDQMANYVYSEMKKQGLINLDRRGQKSRIERNPEDYIKKILNGDAVPYDRNIDLSKIEKAISFGDPTFSLDSLWVESPEYDPYDTGRYSKISEVCLNAAFRKSVPYLIHKKREYTRKGTINPFFDEKSMYLYFSSTGVPSVVSAGKIPAESKLGKFLYDLVGEKTVSTSLDWQTVKENLGKVEDSNPYDYVDDLPMSNRRRFYPSALHPSGLGIQEEELDQDLDNFAVKGKPKNIRKPLSSILEGKTIDQWKDVYLANLDSRINSTYAEEIEKRLGSEDPVSLAKEVISKQYRTAVPGEVFSGLLAKYNKTSGKSLSDSDYAVEFLKNIAKSERYFRQNAIKQKDKISKLNLNSLSPQEKFELFVPTRIKKKKENFLGGIRKPVMLEQSKVEEIASGRILNKYQELAKSDSYSAALAYISEKKDIDNQSAVSFLTDKMNKANKSKTSLGLAPYKDIQEYSKHYLSEALKFEGNYSEYAKKYLIDNKDKKKKLPFPKISNKSELDSFIKLAKVFEFSDSLIDNNGEEWFNNYFARISDSLNINGRISE